ncbi:MAG: chromate efflux transporter, partial [Solirubrobacteraceae bacterium]
MRDAQLAVEPSLAQIVREWGRIGCVGFGGPPAHIALFRELCVTRRGWLSEAQFERAIAATNLLPGPASTQLAIYCAWRLRGSRGALVGGVCFILPGLILILALSALFLAGSPPSWVRGAGMGAGAAVAAVAVRAGLGVAVPIWRRSGADRRPRVLAYALVAGTAAATVGPWLVLVLLACGTIELAWRSGLARDLASLHAWPLLAIATEPGGTGALVWTALKVGALAFGGGFVIIPLMQSDAVNTYHWMTHAQFLNAVALGQVTPGPVTHTVAAVGYAADGFAGGLLAALVAFAPSFSFILFGAARFERLLANERVVA